MFGLPCTCTAFIPCWHLHLHVQNQSLAPHLACAQPITCTNPYPPLHIPLWTVSMAKVWSPARANAGVVPQHHNILCCVGRVFSADKEPRSKLVDRAWRCGGSNRDHASLASGVVGLSHCPCCCDYHCFFLYCCDCRCLYCCDCRCLCLCCCLSLLLSVFDSISVSILHTHTHSLSLVLVGMMKSKELKAKTLHAHSLIFSILHHLYIQAQRSTYLSIHSTPHAVA